MSTLFISHSSKDNEVARDLLRGLGSVGYESVFLDFDPEQGIRGGQNWERTLYRKLRACDAVLVCFSDNHRASNWCFAEIALARMEGKQILTLLVDPLTDSSTLPFILSGHQYLDLRGQSELSLDRLVRDLADLGIEAAPERRWNAKQSPYPGLMAFEEDDSPIYFGRDKESRHIVELLNAARRRESDRVLTILGASGSGKSSVVRAGVIPRLRRDPKWLLIGPCRPGKEPFQELAANLARAFGLPRNETDSIAHELTHASLHSVIARLRRLSDHLDATPLVVVDQFEELLGQRDDGPATGFLGLLDAACASEERPVYFLFTLRSDFAGVLHRRTDVPALLDAQITYSLGPMTKAAMRKVITEPAKLAALDLEDGLVDMLLEDTGTPDALPLLAFALRLLWDRGHEDQLLSVAEYAGLGGLDGAIAVEADAVRRSVEREDPDGHTALPDAFARMVRVADDGSYARAPTAWHDHPTAVRGALRRFVENRLLVSRSDEQGVETVEIAHEALLRRWERLKGWLDERSETLRLRDIVRRAARQWHDQRDEADLLRGARLARAEELVAAGGFDDVRAFVERSRDAELDRSRKEGDVMGMLLSSETLRERIAPKLRELVNEELAAKDAIAKNSTFASYDVDANRQDQVVATLKNIEDPRWHPEEAECIGSTGATRNYIDIYQFPCCGKQVLAEGGPEQFRPDGCQPYNLGK